MEVSDDGFAVVAVELIAATTGSRVIVLFNEIVVQLRDVMKGIK